MTRFDAFYIVIDTRNATVKFGVTNGDGAKRIYQHRLDGFSKTELLLTRYSEAISLESFLKKSLALLETVPVKGKEYFHISHLDTVLHLVKAFRTKGSTPISETIENPTFIDSELFRKAISDINHLWPRETPYLKGSTIAALLRDYDSYWRKALSDNPYTAARRLAGILRPFGMKAATHRIQGKPTQAYAQTSFSAV